MKEMIALRDSGDRPDLTPDAATYTNLISALAKQRNNDNVDAMNDVVAMVKDDTSDNVDSGVYNALIHAQIRVSKEGAAAKAENILRSMLDGDLTSAKTRPVSFKIDLANVSFMITNNVFCFRTQSLSTLSLMLGAKATKKGVQVRYLSNNLFFVKVTRFGTLG